MAIGGLDIGTSGCKFIVFDERNRIIGKSFYSYDVTMVSGQHTLDANTVWESVKKVIHDAVALCPDEKLEALAVSSLGEAATPVDENGKVLAPAQLYTDFRGIEECNYIISTLGKERIMQITGVQPFVMFTINKMLWWKRNTDIYDKAYKYLLFEDFIIFKLTGECNISYSLAARTMGFDIKTKKWSDEIFDAAGLDCRKMSVTVPSGTIVGEIIPKVAEELGLPKGVKIVSGGHDQMCIAIGAGLLSQDVSVNCCGTVECITTLLDGLRNDNLLVENNYPIVPYALEDRYITYASTSVGGSALKWYRDNFAKYEYNVCKSKNISIFKELDLIASKTPTDLIIMPHFAGSGTPYMDDQSKGLMFGLTLETKTIEIYRALMEGLAYELLLNIETLSGCNVKINKLRAAGGGAVSPVWLQIKADIFGKEITALDNIEAGTIGNMMLAATAIGKYKNLFKASDQAVKIGTAFYPDMERHKIYMEKYQKYKKLYPLAKALYK